MHKHIEKAISIFEADANEESVAVASKLIEEGRAKWVLDPEVDNVVGLVDGNDAYVIVYLEFNDFETSELFDKTVFYTI